jgi:hypothetical protein
LPTRVCRFAGSQLRAERLNSGCTGILAIAVLLIIARALEESGTLELLLRNVLGRSSNLFISQLR